MWKERVKRAINQNYGCSLENARHFVARPLRQHTFTLFVAGLVRACPQWRHDVGEYSIEVALMWDVLRSIAESTISSMNERSSKMFAAA